MHGASVDRAIGHALGRLGRLRRQVFRWVGHKPLAAFGRAEIVRLTGVLRPMLCCIRVYGHAANRIADLAGRRCRLAVCMLVRFVGVVIVSAVTAAAATS
jgi:hypothetical protein